MTKKELIDFLNKQIALPKNEREFVFYDTKTIPTPFFDEIEKISNIIFGNDETI